MEAILVILISSIVLIVINILLAFFSIFWHELGHYIAFRVHGYSPDTFVVGHSEHYLTFGNKPKFYFGLFPISGCVEVELEEGEEEPTRKQNLWISIAGVLMNLFLMLVGIALLFFLKNFYVVQFLYLLILDNLILAISSWYGSDGDEFKKAWKSKEV